MTRANFVGGDDFVSSVFYFCFAFVRCFLTGTTFSAYFRLKKYEYLPCRVRLLPKPIGLSPSSHNSNKRYDGFFFFLRLRSRSRLLHFTRETYELSLLHKVMRVYSANYYLRACMQYVRCIIKKKKQIITDIYRSFTHKLRDHIFL